MIHTDDPAMQEDVDKCNRLLAKWHAYIGHNRMRHRGQSLRLYIDPYLFHEFLIHEIMGSPDAGPFQLFGYPLEVFPVHAKDHAFLTYTGEAQPWR